MNVSVIRGGGGLVMISNDRERVQTFHSFTLQRLAFFPMQIFSCYCTFAIFWKKKILLSFFFSALKDPILKAPLATVRRDCIKTFRHERVNVATCTGRKFVPAPVSVMRISLWPFKSIKHVKSNRSAPQNEQSASHVTEERHKKKKQTNDNRGIKHKDA